MTDWREEGSNLTDSTEASRKRITTPKAIISDLTKQFHGGAPTESYGGAVVIPGQPRNMRPMRSAQSWKRWMSLFNLVFLVMPILGGMFYYFIYASDAFQVDMIVAIKNPSSAASGSSGGAAGGMMSGGGMPSTGSTTAERAIDESYAVVNYIQSREAYDKLEQRMDLSKRFQRDEIDWIGRLRPAANHEQRYQYYLKHINIVYDDIEGQVDLTTYAYDADTAYRMASELSLMSEQLVNEFNTRSQADMIKLAKQQVSESNLEMRNAGAEITAFQIKNGMIDPSAETASLNSIITTLRTQSAAKGAELAALGGVSLPTAPRTIEIKNMLAALDSQIKGEKSKLTGQADALAPLINTYKMLAVEFALAQQKYTSAVGMLQSSLLQAEHQKLYVTNIVSPSVPVQPILPDRRIGMLSVVGATLLFWLFARLAVAAIRDHRI